MAFLFIAAPAGAGERQRFALTVQPERDAERIVAGEDATLVVHDMAGGSRPVRVCITPVPVQRPSCAPEETNRPIRNLAFAVSGRTEISFRVSGHAQQTRELVVRGAVGRQPQQYRTLGAAAIASGDTAAVALRLSRPLAADGTARPPFVIAPRLLAGEVIDPRLRFYGGLTPGLVGPRSRSCYVADAQQLVPGAALRPGRGMSVGLRIDGRIAAVRTVRLRRGIDAFAPAFLARAGCR